MLKRQIMNILQYIHQNFNKKLKFQLWLSVLLCIATATVIAVSPAILAAVINRLVAPESITNWYVLIGLSAGYIIILSLGRLLPIMLSVAVMLLQINRSMIFSHSFLRYLYRQTPDFFIKNNTGFIAQQSVQLNNEMHILFNTFIHGFCDPFFRLFVAMLMISFNGNFVIFALFSLYILGFYFSTQYFTPRLILMRNELMDAGRKTYQTQTDSVENITLAKHNNALNFILSRYNDALNEEKIIMRRYANWINYMNTVNGMLSIILFGGCFIYTLYGVVNHTYSVGDFVMITSYIIMLSAPIESLARNYSDMKQSISIFDDFLQKLNQETLTDSNLTLNGNTVEIGIEQLSFRYPESSKEALSDINITLPASKFITFTGHSGSGKTTLVKLLALYDNGYQGKITFNGQNITDYTQASLSDNICFVTQDEFIFMDTLRFNLRVAKPSATDEELLNALKLANFTDHNCTLQGTALLDMTLGNKGMSVSGGQRQRISLARLFLRNPSLIIIDESTASLDLVNEKIVLENIIHMYPKATKISISHRPTTFAYSDLIYVFNEGKISDYGTLQALLVKNEYIREIIKHSNQVPHTSV